MAATKSAPEFSQTTRLVKRFSISFWISKENKKFKQLLSELNIDEPEIDETYSEIDYNSHCSELVGDQMRLPDLDLGLIMVGSYEMTILEKSVDEIKIKIEFDDTHNLYDEVCS